MKIVGVVSLLSLSLVLVGCGTQSDPRSSFSDVPAVPTHSKPVDAKKVYKDGKLFSITVPNGNMNFVEGETASYTIEVSTVYPNARYRLTASNLPEGATLSAVSGQKGVYKITWTPSIGLLPMGKTDDKFNVEINVEVDAKSTTADSIKLRQIAGAGFESLTLTVNKTAENPTFQAVELATTEVVAGEPVAITIIAKAPGISADKTLSLVVADSEFTSREITILKAKKAVTFQAAERSGDSFKFSGLIETKELNVPKSKNPVQARFTVQVVNSEKNRKSTVETVNLTILPKPEPVATPAPTPEPTPSPTPAPTPAETKTEAKPASAQETN